ncbi:MAG: type III-A CRISPR-associated RAMP protein Csm3 [Fusobacteriaceae bacterium]
MRLKSIKEINGTMKLLTGTRVGGNSDLIEIGGNDNPVIRNPLTGELYIPGSSLKGKIRVLTEWLEGKVSDGAVHSCDLNECPVCRVFGRSAQNSKIAKSGPTRISIKDAYLSESSKKELDKLKKRTGLDTEWKYENKINRITSEATPRNLERIPAGIEFNFKITYKVLDMGDNGKIDEQYFENIVLRGLKALLLEGVGGGTSRGNGQIEFTELSVDGISIKDEINNIVIG